VFFKTVDKLIGMRVAPEVEVEGLDLAETGVLAYPNFTLTGTYSSTGVDGLHAPYRTEVRTPVAES